MTHDAVYLRLAATVSVWSDDPSTKNGAVLVPAGTVFEAAVAWNGIPSPLDVRQDRLERPLKYRYVEHAERAAVYRAALMGTPTLGSRLYCPWFACADCARAIICAGVVEVVGSVRARNATPDRWLEEVIAGEELLREAGVGMRWLAEPLGVRVLFDGREIDL